MLELKKIVSVTFMKKILKNKKINFKCNYENGLKFLRKRNMRKIVVGKKNLTLYQINLILS